MRRGLLLLALAVTVSTLAAPATAHAGTGSTIFQRFWDSMVTTWKNRTESEAPVLLTLIEQGEEIFLGDTADLTELPAVQDAMAAARVAGGILLAFCIAVSLGEVTVGQATGSGLSLTGWFWRLLVATVMTFGSLPITGAIVRFCNYLLYEVRTYLDMHYTATTRDLWEGLVELLAGDVHVLLVLLFLVVLFVLLLLMWFLYGGIRVAEVVIHMLLWPLTWPLYLIPSLEDVPKSATRGFIMWAALPLMVVLMIRTAIRMVVGSSVWGSIWAFVPALCLLGMTLFLPAAVRRIFGQGHTGTGLVVTAAKVLAGLKFAALAGAAGGTSALAASAPAGGAAAAPATSMRSMPMPGMPPVAASSFDGAFPPPSALDTGAVWARTREVPYAEPPSPPVELPGGAPLPALGYEPTIDQYKLIGAPTPWSTWGIVARQWPDGRIDYLVPPEDVPPHQQFVFSPDAEGWWVAVGRLDPSGQVDYFGPGADTSGLPRFRLDEGPLPEGDDT